MWWEIGSIIPAPIAINMSLQERDFFTGYDRVMSQFVSHFPELDLTSVRPIVLLVAHTSLQVGF